MLYVCLLLPFDFVGCCCLGCFVFALLLVALGLLICCVVVFGFWDFVFGSFDCFT